MTREEIQEGIALKLYEIDGGTQGYWETSPKDRKEYRHRAKLMAEYLDSAGLVLKVEGWLPTRNGMVCTVESLIAPDLSGIILKSLRGNSGK